MIHVPRLPILPLGETGAMIARKKEALSGRQLIVLTYHSAIIGVGTGDYGCVC